MGKVILKCETITPIWTGDAWGENREIKPSSIMGSLRFWFEVYCHFAGIEVKEKEELKDKAYKKIVKDVKNKFEKDKQINIENEIFNTLPLTLPSKIFGCTGWKSRIEIKRIIFEKDILHKNDFDYNLLHKENNTHWWTKQTLFDNKEQITVFKNIKIDLIINNNILNIFKTFLKFYEDKPILIGGKKSFGFGFTKITSDLDLANIEIKTTGNNKENEIVFWDSIEIKNNNKIISGYNIKYFLRKKENKKNRTKNFGKKSQASDYYFSFVQEDRCHIITFNNSIPLLGKYKNWIRYEL